MMLALLSLAHATLVASALDPAGLARLSTSTVYGDVVSTRTERTARAIVTVATVRRLDGDGEVDIRLPGGCYEGLCLTIAGVPTARVGERVFVFLRGDEPTSWAQGFFEVTGGVARRDVRGLAFLDHTAPEATYPLAQLRAVVVDG
jgi:hypothetical protein